MRYSNLKQVIIINGSGGVGKDEFVRQCRTILPTLNYSSVHKIKGIAYECGWRGQKSEKDRKFLSDLKVLCSEYSDLPFKCIKKEYIDFKHSNYKLLFLHIREPEEIERAKKEFNAVTLLITNPNVKQVTSNEADANVFNYEYDYVIDNNGSIDDLRDMAMTFIEVLENKQLDEKLEFEDIKVEN